MNAERDGYLALHAFAEGEISHRFVEQVVEIHHVDQLVQLAPVVVARDPSRTGTR